MKTTTHTLIIELTYSTDCVRWVELIEHQVACDDVQSELVALESAPDEARFDRVLEIDGAYNSWTAHRAVKLLRHPYLRAEVAP
jgi:hypothetical protein